MRSLVTGAAGFVGSHLCDLLLAEGHDVVGVDAFTDYYDVELKERNVAAALASTSFDLVRADLLTAPLDELLEGVDVVYHLAGQPGVRPSWGDEFGVYAERNVLVTQRLLEAVRERPIRKLVYASSSSVYGDAEAYPTAETLAPRPVSPYGVTKLAGEHLCELYRSTSGVPTASLRLFTVYGPRQRPDMAFARMVSAALDGRSFELFGDGEQTRDFTYVSDVVKAFRDAASSEWTGVANIGGGARVSMNDVVLLLQDLTGGLDVRRGRPQKGDVRHTAADTTVAAEGFGYAPAVSVAEGLLCMVHAARASADIPRQPAAAVSNAR